MTNKAKEDTLLVFPCEFPIKVVGLANTEFESAALTIIRSHAPDLTEDSIKTRLSKDGKYLAITITIQATSKAHLDNIYLELTANQHILVAL